MDSIYEIYLQRSQNELNLSIILLKLSDNKELQLSVFSMKEDTYYSAVISHAYYCIFYAAKAYLLTKNIKTEAPEEHKKTFNEFSKFTEKGVLDIELLKIYENMLVRADTLLHIFELEKGKRGKFTYKKISQANQDPAVESVNNARFFFKNIYNLINSMKK